MLLAKPEAFLAEIGRPLILSALYLMLSIFRVRSCRCLGAVSVEMTTRNHLQSMTTAHYWLQFPVSQNPGKGILGGVPKCV